MSDSANCGPLAIQFTNQSITNNNDPFSSLLHLWNYGDGVNDTASNPSHSFLADLDMDTNYLVSLKTTSINGCSDSTSKIVKVYPQPKINFIADKYDGCALLDVNFTNQSLPGDTGNISLMTFNWYAGNGLIANTTDFNARYIGSANGDTIYQVKLIGYSEHGCIDSSVRLITVHPQPIALFNTNSQSLCTPAHIQTVNLSQSTDGYPLTHEWDFNNGYISNSTNDSSVYFNNSDSDVVYTIQYQSISTYGCRDTTSVSITIHPKPKADFSVSSLKICSPAIVTLNDLSQNASNYHWSEGNNVYGDSTTQSIILPGLKLFDTTYIIAHSVRSTFGCLSDTVYQLIQVHGRPDAEFALTKDSGCSRESVQLLNLSLGAFQYNWKMGDNTVSQAVNPKHFYKANIGFGADTSFQIQLEAISPQGCKDTITKPVTLVRPSTAGINLDKQLGCTDLDVTLKNNSKDFKTLYWDLGDNSGFYTDDSLQHTFVNNSGNITFQPKVTLIRSRFNCMDTTSVYLFVYPKPIAAFKVQRTDPCNDGTHQFVNQSSFSNQTSWLVDQNALNNVNSFLMKLSPSYYRDSQYQVQLICNNNYGCSDTLSQVVKVKPKLLLNFERNPLVACEKATVNFTNKSFNAIRYLWKFGDGGLSNDLNPSHAYNSFGNYQIKLFGYDKDGCVDSSAGSTFIKILERPIADFDYLPAYPKLPNAQVDFNATPTILTVNINTLSFDWDFGDGNYPENNYTIKNPSHIYTKAGTYAITLKVANQGCDNSVTKYLFVEDPKPDVNFTADTLEGCAPFLVNFKNSTTNVTSYRWIFGDGSPDSYDKEPSHVFRLPGTWDVTLVATGTGGTSTMTKDYLITTYPQPVLDFYTTQRFLSLPNAIFNMRNNSNSVYNSWDVIDSTGLIIQSSKLRDPSFIINSLGLYTVRLIGTNSYGCIDTLIKPSYIGT
ncbi:MAG: PKD domain-containing protein, partial [Bacteroidia bacterium]|nr:PKD domain-containing protein [Bacteroidia bacterium]